MKWEQFKNKLRKDTYQQEVEVDMDALWDALEPTVDALNKEEPRRKRFIFWIFLAGILIAIASWCGSLALDFQYDMFQNEAKQANEYKSKQHSEESQESILFKKQNKLPITTREKEIKANLDLNHHKINRQITPNSDLNDTNVIAFSKKKNQLKQQNLKLNKTSTSNTSTLQTIIASPKSQDSDTLIFSTKNIRNDNFNIKNTIKTFEENTKPQAITNQKIDEKKPLITKSELPILARLKPILLLDKTFISLSDSSLQAMLRTPINETFSSKKMSPNHPKKLTFFFNVNGGSSFVNRSLEAKTNADDTLFQNRTIYETPLKSTYYGISLGLAHRSGFRFSLGFQNTEISERFDFNETRITEDSIIGVRSLRLNLDGDTIPIMGLISRTTTTKSQIRIYNTYQLLDIPITMAYYHSFDDKWNVGVEASIFANLALKTKGIVFDKMEQEVDIAKDQATIFKSKIGLNYRLGVSIGRTFYNKLELSISPTVRFFPKDFSIESYGVSQQYVLIGGNLGLTYRFSN